MILNSHTHYGGYVTKIISKIHGKDDLDSGMELWHTRY